MSELRQNLATKEWVVISAERARKPNAVLNKIIGTLFLTRNMILNVHFVLRMKRCFPLKKGTE